MNYIVSHAGGKQLPIILVSVTQRREFGAWGSVGA